MTNWILTAIYKAIWGVFVSGPLYLVSGFNDVLYYLSGGVIYDLLFGGKKGFTWSTIPYAFWGFCILAAAIIVIIFLVQFIALHFGEHKEIKHKIVHAVKMTAFACVFVFFIPIGFFCLNQFIVFIQGTLSQVFGVNNLNIAGMVWNIGNPDWNGKDVYNGDFFTAPGNILKYNLMAEVFGTWFITFAVIMLGLALVQKIFELFFLFITGPVVGATMVNDGGKRMMIWKDYVIAKSLAALGTIIAYYVFMVGIGAILSGALGGFSGASRQILIILLICGGCLSCMGISNIIASFVGEGVGIREGMASISSTFAAAKLTMGSAVMVGKAIGFGKSKKAQLQGASGGVLTPGGMDFATQQSNMFAQNNQGSERVMSTSASGFKLPTNGLRQRSGALYMAGTALALASTSVFAVKAGYNKRVDILANRNTSGKATKLDKVTAGVVTFGAGVTGITAAKKLGRGIKKTGQVLKENTHGVYDAKREHHKKSKVVDKQTTDI